MRQIAEGDEEPQRPRRGGVVELNSPPSAHLTIVQIVSKMRYGKTMSVRICRSDLAFGGPDFAK